MNLKLNFLSLLCFTLILTTFSTGAEKLSFLQNDESYFVKFESVSNSKVTDYQNILIEEKEAFTLSNDGTKAFTLNVLRSGMVHFDLSLDYIDNQINKTISLIAVIRLEKDYEPQTITILNVQLYLNSGSALVVTEINNTRSPIIDKGKYNGTLIFFLNEDTSLDCKSILLKVSENY